VCTSALNQGFEHLRSPSGSDGIPTADVLRRLAAVDAQRVTVTDVAGAQTRTAPSGRWNVRLTCETNGDLDLVFSREGRVEVVMLDELDTDERHLLTRAAQRAGLL